MNAKEKASAQVNEDKGKKMSVEVWYGVTVWMSCVNEKGQRSEVDEREGDV